MIVPFKIALIAAILAVFFWLVAIVIIRSFGSPFPRVTYKGDLWGGAFVLASIAAFITALSSGIFGIIVV